MGCVCLRHLDRESINFFRCYWPHEINEEVVIDLVHGVFSYSLESCLIRTIYSYSQL